MFNKTTYELSLTRNYVSKWGMVEAVRELIQNALDSESPFNYEFLTKDGLITLKLTSEFTVLQPQTLLLGATSKADSQDSIGSFGEGYKLALLVLTRLGYEVNIYNGDKSWKPKFHYSRQFKEELLIIEEEGLPVRNRGLTFEISGLSESDVMNIRESCLHMQDHHGEKKTTAYGDILLEKAGKLYVGGLFICETDLTYGYNVKPEYLQLERDRSTVSSWDLKSITKLMWFDTKDYPVIAQLLEKEIPDLEYAEYGSSELVREACYQHFRSKNPTAVVARTQQELNQLIAAGLKEVVIVTGSFSTLIKDSVSYKTEHRIIIKSPKQLLEEWYGEHKYRIHHTAKSAFEIILKKSDKWRE